MINGEILFFRTDIFRYCDSGQVLDPNSKKFKPDFHILQIITTAIFKKIHVPCYVLIAQKYRRLLRTCYIEHFMKAGLVSLDDISNLEEFFHTKNPKITFTDKKRYVKSDNE